MEFHHVIAARRSLRAFSERSVEKEKIERMLDAARWSPSCANRQPWRFIVVEAGVPSRAAVEETLDAGNAWAKRAPVLIVAGARREDGAVVESRDYFLLDTGMALMSLVYRGVDQGLLVHPMAGWKEEPLRAALGLPGDFTPAAVVAVGYGGKNEDLDEDARKKDGKPRVRKPLGEVAFRSRWGEPLESTLSPLPRKMYEVELQLRFADTDGLGHVNNTKVTSYLEVGRVNFFTNVMGLERVKDIRHIIAEVTCRYRIPILLHDRVVVRLYITDVHRSSFRFRYELYDPRDGRIFVEAETVQVAYDFTTGRPAPIDADFLAKAGDYIGG